MPRTGSALLPLHYGAVPPWLASRMARLGRVIVEAIVHEYGTAELLRRLAHPFWFQSFGSVMGMDWHSSGITTSVLGALKRGLAPIAGELGVYVCGGKGAESRKTPAELMGIAERTGLDGEALVRASRLVAKVDSAAVQDGFEVYLHGFIVAADGSWVVVQQGMNPELKQARRYHWLSERVVSFVDAPHSAIDGPNSEQSIVNLVDHRAQPSQAAQLALVEAGPDSFLAEYRKILRPDASAADRALTLPHMVLPDHHDVRREDVDLRRLGGTLAAVATRGPSDYEELLLTPGVGARTLFALAQVAEVVHGAPCRFRDPARFSLAHGGKDGHPYPVPTRVYDDTIRVLREAVDRAKLGNDDKLCAIRHLDAEARRLEDQVIDVDFDGFIAEENRRSHEYGGRTVMGPARPPKPVAPPRAPGPDDAQLAIPGLALGRSTKLAAKRRR